MGFLRDSQDFIDSSTRLFGYLRGKTTLEYKIFRKEGSDTIPNTIQERKEVSVVSIVLKKGRR